MDRDWLSMWFANWSSATMQHVGHGRVGTTVFTMHARCYTELPRLVPRCRRAYFSASLVSSCLPAVVAVGNNIEFTFRGVRFCVTLFFFVPWEFFEQCTITIWHNQIVWGGGM